MELALVNDLIVPLEEALVSAHDRGLYFGDGVYEVVAWRNGRLFAWERHQQRLRRSLREMQMLERVDLAQIEQRVRRAVEASGLEEAVVYFHVTRGRGPRKHDWPADWQMSFLLTVRSRPAAAPEAATAITHPDWRWKRCDIKSLNLLANVLAKHAAGAAGAYEAVLVDEKGLVTEGAVTSVLMVEEGALRTAPLTANILPGITRALLLEAAGEAGLAVREESFTVAEALKGAELMLTGTTAEVIGVTHLDGERIGDGRVGRYTRRLREILVARMGVGE